MMGKMFITVNYFIIWLLLFLYYVFHHSIELSVIQKLLSRLMDAPLITIRLLQTILTI